MAFNTGYRHFQKDGNDMCETSYSRVNPKTDIRERKYNSKSEELQERVRYYIYCLVSGLGLV